LDSIAFQRRTIEIYPLTLAKCELQSWRDDGAKVALEMLDLAAARSVSNRRDQEVDRDVQIPPAPPLNYWPPVFRVVLKVGAPQPFRDLRVASRIEHRKRKSQIEVIRPAVPFGAGTATRDVDEQRRYEPADDA
jgi:hypothetical protein